MRREISSTVVRTRTSFAHDAAGKVKALVGDDEDNDTIVLDDGITLCALRTNSREIETGSIVREFGFA